MSASVLVVVLECFAWVDWNSFAQRGKALQAWKSGGCACRVISWAVRELAVGCWVAAGNIWFLISDLTSEKACLYSSLLLRVSLSFVPFSPVKSQTTHLTGLIESFCVISIAPNEARSGPAKLGANDST